MTGQTLNPDGTTSVPTGAPAATPGQSPDPATSQQPASLHPDVYAPDGKRWRDKFYGQDGAISKLQNDAARAAGIHDQTIAGLQEQLRIRDSQIATLNTSSANAQAQIDSIAGLNQTITELQARAGLVDTYRALTEYPDLLNVQVEESVPATEPGGEPTTRTVNPLLALVESSNLPPDQLRAQMAQLATFYRTGQQQQPAAPPAPVAPGLAPIPGPPAVPSPATPLAQNTVAYWRQRALEAQGRMIEGDAVARTEHREAWEKVRELEKAATP